MNERIRELAEQARDWAEVSYKKQNEQFTSHWDTPIGYTPSQFFEQKFAELIVEEMHDFIMEESANDNGIPDLGKVKEHFGVEE